MRPSIFIIFVTAVLSAPAYAVTDQERSALQQLHTELASISTLIDKSQHASNPLDKRQIDYQLLKEDLKKIQQGILDAVNAERREPRALPPIDGEYY